MVKKDAKIAAKAKAAVLSSIATSSNATTLLTSSPPSLQQSLFQELSQSVKISYKTYTDDLKKDSTLQLIDYFLGFLVLLGALQFVYCILVGNFPFNAFLGGFISTVGQFVLTVSLRLQTYNTKLFTTISKERAVGDYILASLILHFIVYHFIN